MAIEHNGAAAEVLNEDPLVIKNLKDWYHSHAYGGWGKFFKGLRQGKLLATRCTNPECREHRLWLPPRCHCPDCWHDTEWVEAPVRGTIYSFTTVLYPGALFRLAAGTPLISVELAGVCTKMMSYLKEGKPRIGLPVKAVFNTQEPTNTILGSGLGAGMNHDSLPPFIEELPPAKLEFAGLRGWVVKGERWLVTFMEAQETVTVPRHHHGAQWGVVLDGAMELSIGDETRLYERGGTHYIPAGVDHEATLFAGWRGLYLFAR